MNRIYLASLVGSILMTGCQSGITLPGDQEIVNRKNEAETDVTGRHYKKQVIVTLSDEHDWLSLQRDMKRDHDISLSVLDRVHGQPILLLETDSEIEALELAKELKKDSRVIAAGYNHTVSVQSDSEAKPRFRSNDPLLTAQWALQNEGQEAPQALAGLPGVDIGMGGVTAEGNPDVIVGVIDTGIDYLHEDLANVEMVDGRAVIQPGSNIWINPEEIPGNGVDDDNNGFIDDVYGYDFADRRGDPRDDHGHGTHCAGVIGAQRDNLKGVSGINKHVSLMALKFLGADGSGDDMTAIQAIYYAIGIKKRFPNKKIILSNSWGSSSREAAEGDIDDHLLMAFSDASREDILSVIAAGNSATSNRFTPAYPAVYSTKTTHIITVAATNNWDKLASFSSYGYTNVQVAAPGVLIMSTLPPYLFPEGYGAWSGTSMATPHVSGLAALIWGSNMGMTGLDVKERILNTVDLSPNLYGLVSTGGRINVRRALENDVNVKILPVAEEVPYVIESPKSEDTLRFDRLQEISEPGAKQIQVCFERVDLDSSDFIEVLDAHYSIKDRLTGRLRTRTYDNSSREICSAPVLGDKIYLRHFNHGLYYFDPEQPTMALAAVGADPQGYKTAYLKVIR